MRNIFLYFEKSKKKNSEVIYLIFNKIVFHTKEFLQLSYRPNWSKNEVAIYGRKTMNFKTFLTMLNTLYGFFMKISNSVNNCSNLFALRISTFKYSHRLYITRKTVKDTQKFCQDKRCRTKLRIERYIMCVHIIFDHLEIFQISLNFTTATRLQAKPFVIKSCNIRKKN